MEIIVKKIILGFMFIGLLQLYATEFRSSNLNNFIQNMEKYQNQNIEILFDTPESISLTTSINDGYYAIENISDYTRYIELNDSNFIISKDLVSNGSFNIKSFTCTVSKSDNSSKFHFHKYICDIKNYK
jgi:hypothetical protein